MAAVKKKNAAKPLKKKGSAPSKPAVRKAAPAPKKKPSAAAKPKAKPAKKTVVKAKPAAKAKVVAKAKPAAKAKTVVKAKPAPKAKPSKKTAAKVKPAPKVAKKAPAKHAAAPAKHVPAKHAAAAAKHAPAPAKKTAPMPPSKAVAHPAPVHAAKPRAPRRPRIRPQDSTGPVAAWIPQPEQRRPSSFIPAPPRAQSAFSVAAPPASSDRLLRPTDLVGIEQAIRTSPVRVDIEIVNGRTVVSVYPEDVNIRAGEGIEWDFRYLSGTDVMVDGVIIEFTKPAPFKTTTFHAKRPGMGRPHRQLSGPALASLVGQTVKYTVRCVDLYKNEIARATPSVAIIP